MDVDGSDFRCTSFKERGFSGLKFDSPPGDCGITDISDAAFTGKRKLDPGGDATTLYFQQGKLKGIQKAYFGDNEGYLTQVYNVFGKPSVYRTFVQENREGTYEVTLAFYDCPNSYVILDLGSRVDRRFSSSDGLSLGVYEKVFADAILGELSSITKDKLAELKTLAASLPTTQDWTRTEHDPGIAFMMNVTGEHVRHLGENASYMTQPGNLMGVAFFRPQRAYKEYPSTFLRLCCQRMIGVAFEQFPPADWGALIEEGASYDGVAGLHWAEVTGGEIILNKQGDFIYLRKVTAKRSL